MLFFDPEDLLDIFLTDELFEGTLSSVFLAVIVTAILCGGMIWLRHSCPDRSILSVLWIVGVAICLTLAPLAAGLLVSWMPGNASGELLVQHYLLATFAVGVYISAVTRQPTRVPGRVGALMEITDGDFHARVCELSRRMHLRCPVIRLARSATADHATMAFAGGLVAPSIIVTDGILTRLTTDERDAIVGHELAHIANGTFWYLMVVASLAGTGMTIAMAYGISTSFLIGTALFVGLQRLVMRRLELDCDLRAAKAIGFPEIATALQKIHQLGIDGNTSVWLRRLIHATGTHPSLAARIKFLRHHAQDDDLDQMPVPQEADAALTWLAMAAWLMLVGGGWWVGARQGIFPTVVSVCLLLIATTTPWILLQAGQSREALLLQLKRLATGVGWLTGGLLALSSPFWLAGFMTQFPGDTESSIPWLGISLAAVPMFYIVLAFFLIRITRRNTFRSQLITAWESYDFISVLKLIKRNRQHARTDPDILYREGMAHAILGDRLEAIRLFEDLVARHPDGINYHIALTATLIEMSRPEDALSLCDAIISKSPKTGIGQAIAARCLRRLGRLDEARTRIRQAIECNPRIGAYYAAEAGVAIDQGEFETARDLLRKAGEVAPGTPQELVEDARLAMRTEPLPIVIQKLKRAIEALKANPLILRQSELISLKNELDRLTGGTASPRDDDAEWVTEFVDDTPAPDRQECNLTDDQ